MPYKMKQLPMDTRIHEWYEAGNGEPCALHTEALFDHCRKVGMPAQLIQITRHTAESLVKEGRVSLQRLKELDSVQVHKPVVFIVQSNHTHRLVDGANRYTWSSIYGMMMINAFIVPMVVWRQYLVTDYPFDRRSV